MSYVSFCHDSRKLPNRISFNQSWTADRIELSSIQAIIIILIFAEFVLSFLECRSTETLLGGA